jgi:hypothetical protein
MLNNLSKQIRECLDHAEDCARKGAAQTDPKLKADFLDMERRWLKLAASYEFSQRLGGFSNRAERQTNKSRRQRSASITAFLRDQQFDLETIEAMGTAFATTCRALGLGNQDDAMTTFPLSIWLNAGIKIRRRCIWPRSRNLSPIRSNPNCSL